jgi:hypothetical protein
VNNTWKPIRELPPLQMIDQIYQWLLKEWRPQFLQPCHHKLFADEPYRVLKENLEKSNKFKALSSTPSLSSRSASRQRRQIPRPASTARSTASLSVGTQAAPPRGTSPSPTWLAGGPPSSRRCRRWASASPASQECLPVLVRCRLHQ